MITHATPVRRDITYDHDEQQATLPIALHRLDGTTETTTLVLDPAQPPTVPAGVSCGQVGNVVTCTGLDVAGSLSSGLPGGTVEHLVLHVIAPPQPGAIVSGFMPTVKVAPTPAFTQAPSQFGQ